MELIFEPQAPFHLAATGLAIAVGLILFLALLRARSRAALAGNVVLRMLVIGSTISAVVLLAGAAWNPIITEESEPEPIHLAVAFDISPSMIRPDEYWEQTRNEVGDLLEDVIETLPDDLREQGSASIVVFRNDATLLRPPPDSLEALPDRVRQLDAAAIDGDGSDIAAGLRRAQQEVFDAGGRGAVLLVSDGLQTEGEAETAARELAAAGIPVYVYPVRSQGTEVALLAADLPRQTYAGDPLLLRGVLWNARTDDTPVALSLSLNTGLNDASPRLGGAVATEPLTQTVAAESMLPLRSRITFAGGYGLQFLDLAINFDAGLGEQRRRFYTYVKRPLRLLAIGGDQRWQSAFPEGAAEITSLAAGELALAGDLRSYDVMVISAVAAQDFAAGELAQIAAAVEQSGVGLMMLNGDHAGRSDEEVTIIKSYDDTPIASILPLKSGPRPFESEPPTRHVIFLIDTSGSMSGWPLEKAKEIVADVIIRLLRPVDTIDIIAFTDKAFHLVKNQAMTPAAKRDAITKLSTLQADGRTDLSQAVSLVAGQQYEDCGLIYVTDGEFNPVSLRPDCRATAFAIGGNITPALSALADPFPVGPTFNPTTITIPYFEPEQRTRLWESGDFQAFSLAPIARIQAPPPIPELLLPGNAIAHSRDDDTEIIAIRPKVRDPVLAYRQAQAGYVGMFTSGLTENWLTSEQSLEALREWISRLAPLSAGERYSFQLQDDGAAIGLSLSLVAENAQLPRVEGVGMRIQVGDQAPVELVVTDDPGAPATFRTRITVPRAEQAQEATLIIEESGPDALPRPQRIPLIIPPQGAVARPVTTEAYSFGSDLALLDAVAAAGGASRVPLGPNEPLFQLVDPQRERWELWPILLVLAAIMYWIAILIGKLGR
ncbi:MAG: VWA domain-containing protein [Oscillochloris sp.]|nr:VWA domain-containing protein [Oscillochloris sp.]